MENQGRGFFFEQQGRDSPKREFPPLHKVSPKRTKEHGRSTTSDYQTVDTHAVEDQEKVKENYKKITVDLPEKVRHQVGKTCICNAIAYYLEWYILKHHRKIVVIDIGWFVYEYEKKAMVTLDYDQIFRAIIALNICRDQGVTATSCGMKHLLVRISGYGWGNTDDYEIFEKKDETTVFDHLKKGIPLLGSFSVGKKFESLGSGIYDPATEVKILGTHMVMFVGHGCDKGRAYLVFLNSHGKEWGENGLGCVYFDQVLQLEHDKGFRFIKLKNVKEEPWPQQSATSSQSSTSGIPSFSNEKHMLPDVPASELTNQPHQEKPDPRTEIPFRSYPGQSYGDTEHRSAPDDREMFRHDNSNTFDELHTPYGRGPAIAKAKKEDAAKEGELTMLIEEYNGTKYEAYQKKQLEEPIVLLATVTDIVAKSPAWKVNPISEMVRFRSAPDDQEKLDEINGISMYYYFPSNETFTSEMMNCARSVAKAQKKWFAKACLAECYEAYQFLDNPLFMPEFKPVSEMVPSSGCGEKIWCLEFISTLRRYQKLGDPGEGISQAATEHANGEAEEEEDATKDYK